MAECDLWGGFARRRWQYWTGDRVRRGAVRTRETLDATTDRQTDERKTLPLGEGWLVGAHGREPAPALTPAETLPPREEHRRDRAFHRPTHQSHTLEASIAQVNTRNHKKVNTLQQQ